MRIGIRSSLFVSSHILVLSVHYFQQKTTVGEGYYRNLTYVGVTHNFEALESFAASFVLIGPLFRKFRSFKINKFSKIDRLLFLTRLMEKPVDRTIVFFYPALSKSGLRLKILRPILGPLTFIFVISLLVMPRLKGEGKVKMIVWLTGIYISPVKNGRMSDLYNFELTPFSME